MKKITILMTVLIAITIRTNAQWISQSSGVSVIIQSVVFTDANTGIAVGNGGLILRTTNGGANWIAQTSGTTNDLFEVFFVDANLGYAVGYVGTILKTTDGGISWTTQNSGTTNQLSSVYFVDANTGYAAGGAFGIQTILKTVDGGMNWTSQTTVNSQQLSSIYFTSADTGYASGNGGTILKTINGGATWTALTSGTSQILRSIYFTDANTGYAVGGIGTIKKTIDGGANWASQTSGIISSFFSIQFKDINTGYAVGDFGKILKTVDGGTNWTQETSGTENTLFFVCFAEGNAVYVVGAAGTILTTDLPPGLPVSNFTVTDDTICIGDSIAMINQSVDAIDYAWEFPGGSPEVSNAIEPIVTYSSAGIKTITLTASSGEFSDTYAWTIEVLPDPLASISDVNPVCFGDSIVLNGSIENASSFVWSPTTGLSDTLSLTPSCSPTENIEYTLTADNGNCSATAVVLIEVVPYPLVMIGNVNPVCIGDSIVLNGSIENASSFAWSPTPGLSDPLSLTPSCAPTEDVEYTLTADNGYCSSTAVVSIEVLPYPVATIGDVNPVCVGDSIALNGSIENASSFAWSPASGLSDPLSLTPICAPTEDVEYTLTADNGYCSSTAVVSIEVLPNPVATIGDVNPLCVGDSIALNGSIENASSFAWSPASGLSDPLSLTPFCAPTEDVEYTLTADNGYCSATAVVFIEVNPLPEPVIQQSGNVLGTSSFSSYQWYLGGNLLSGALGQTYLPTVSGNYTVEVTDANGCVGLSAGIDFIVGGVEEVNLVSIQFYPNPFSDRGEIRVDALCTHYDVVNALGQVLDSGTIAWRKELNTANWPAGMYTLRVYNVDGQRGAVHILHH